MWNWVPEFPADNSSFPALSCGVIFSQLVLKLISLTLPVLTFTLSQVTKSEFTEDPTPPFLYICLERGASSPGSAHPLLEKKDSNSSSSTFPNLHPYHYA
jgi:hypothetical protein